MMIPDSKVSFAKLCSSFPLKFYSWIPEFCTYYSFTVSLLFSKSSQKKLIILPINCNITDSCV